MLRDLGSRNGTVVNGALSTGDTLLRAEDVLRIGDILLKYVPSGASDYRDYRIDGSVAPGVRRLTIPGAVGGMQMARVSAEVATAARAGLPVLISGETGTGKELVARALHIESGRRGPFVAVNCAAIPSELVESELFGFRKGAFTGAVRDHAGFFRAASGGTILLDEIGDMPLAAQAKLLRTLETQEIQPLGGVQTERVDVRIVAASHRDLRARVTSGDFRGDLFARLHGYAVTLPALRDRREDLWLLVQHVLAAVLATTTGPAPRDVTFRYMMAMARHDWPFNIRELAAVVRRSAAVATKPVLDIADLPESFQERMASYGAARASVPSTTSPSRATPQELSGLLRTHQGNVSAVARALGKDRAQVHRWLQHAGLDPAAFR